MKTIIFGNRELAQLAKYYLEKDSSFKPYCFVVDEQYLNGNTFSGLPLLCFDEIEFFSEEYVFFAPIYDNKLREATSLRILQKGYRLISYVSSHATTWNAEIGYNCFIFEGVNVQPFSKIGNNVIIWSNTHIGHHSVVGNNNFFSSQVVVAGQNMIEPYCFLGSNCSTREKLIIAEGTLVGMGAAVVKDTMPWSVYKGVPARNDKLRRE